MRRARHLTKMIALSAFSLLVGLSACNYGTPPPQATPFPDAEFTRAAMTIVAELTLNAPQASSTSAPSATSTPQPPTVTLTPEPSATPTATPTSTRAPNTIFDDNFEEDESWFTDSNDDFSFAYGDGNYQITVNLQQAQIWSVRNQSFDDIRVEVDAARLDGPEDAYYGVMCRHEDGENYYAFLLAADGSYAIARVLDGEFEFLEQGSNADLATDLETYRRVRGDCVGDSLSLYVDEQALLSTQDSEFSEGDIGLIVSTRLNEGLIAVFDNFTLIEP